MQSKHWKRRMMEGLISSYEKKHKQSKLRSSMKADFGCGILHVGGSLCVNSEIYVKR